MDFRARTIRLAASFPAGSSERAALLAALHEGSATRTAAPYLTADPKYRVQVSIDSVEPVQGRFPSGVPDGSSVWNVSGEIGIFTLTFTPQDFTCVMYVPPRSEDRVYLTNWKSKVTGDGGGWLMRAMDDLLRERSREVLQVLQAGKV